MADKLSPEEARAQLVEALWSDPESRRDLEGIIVKKFPATAAALPGYEARKEAGAVLDVVQKERDEYRREREADKAAQMLATARRGIVDDPVLRIREDEIPEVERIMADELVGTHRTAAEVLRARQAAIAGSAGGTNGLMEIPGVNGAGGDEYKGLVENPDKWARAKAHEVIRDIERQRGKSPAWA